ncbi:hypothetical protein THRCLA_08832 [Thraustotheca clavata]|uniref:Uncharacterized protein n=1 Tax=Thraustotheca clavata TaxID=74557 RepID=A0A1V9Z254_9STRA|nr:hypothetical protein THRCLA_08832 [Thraustotheca clavata]
MAAFLKAVGNGDIDKVEKLFDNIHFQNKKGESALHVAIAEGQLEMLEFLVNHGANVNLQDKKAAFTPIMLALAQQPMNYLDMIEIMMKQQPDLTIKDKSGQTALHLAAQFGKADSVALLLKTKMNLDIPDAKSKMTPLITAAGRGHFDVVQLLVQKGHSLNAVDNQGNSALHWACMSQCEDAAAIITMLCEKGAKSIPNHEGDFPLHAEAAHCDPKKPWPSAIGSFLSGAFPASTTARNRKGLTPEAVYNRAEEDEAVVVAPKAVKGKKQPIGDSEEEKQILLNAQKARAAAIAQTKKRWTRQVEEPEELDEEIEQQEQVVVENNTSPLTKAIIVAIVVGFFAILYSFFDSLAKKN